jgi:serine O-acetyltransferase
MINLYHLLTLHFPQIDVKDRGVLDVELSLSPETLAIHIYRVQQELIQRYGEPNIQELLLGLSYLQRMYTQIEIYYSAIIGKNLTIRHGLGIVIGARVVIGDDVTIYQNVTIGDRGDDTKERPVIENGVRVYAGAKILGGVRIGEHSIIGANAVVINSFEAMSVVAGIPARLIKMRKE